MPAEPQETRRRILEAAELLFAQQGFAGTTIKDIGTASTRNTALIHYYFASKEQLYKAVLRHVLGQIIEGMGKALGADDDPEHTIREFVRAQVAMLRAKPHLLQLMVREMSDSGAAHAEDQIHELGATVFARLRALVERGQREGTFRADLDPRFVAISLVAQVNWFFLARPAVGVLLGRGLGDVREADQDQFADHAAELVISGLRPYRARPATHTPAADGTKARVTATRRRV